MKFRAAAWAILVVTILSPLSQPALAEDEEKILNIYTWADYVPVEVIQEFEFEYGIKVNYNTYDNDNILSSKLLAGSSGFDLVGIADTALQRLIPTGVFRKQDKSKLPNLKYMDPEVMERIAYSDPGNEHVFVYTWGSTGIAYNLDLVLDRLPDAPLDSAAMIFDPEIIRHFADCGVAFVDDAETTIRMALMYLGYDINETSQKAFDEAERVLKAVRPYVRYFSGSLPQIDMAAEELCLSMMWSGDYSYSLRIAADAGKHLNIDYSVPKEGSNIWIDTFAMPADLPHPENAHLFLNFMMRPEIAAKCAEFTQYSVGNLAAFEIIDPATRNNPHIYPPPETRALMHLRTAYDLKTRRRAARLWARMKANFN
jgi:putrescine transport system substrate-binding protein